MASSKKGVQFYSAWYSPFAHRVWIALLEKKVDFEYIETDPSIKTPEFLAVNPLGLVPAIVHKGRALYESTVCVEYIDEVWKNEPALLPEDPYDRAVARIWVDFISKKIVPVFYRIVIRQSKDEQDEAKEEFLKNLETLTKAMSNKGPFFFGENFGFVDIVLVAHGVRFFILKHYRNFEIPRDDRFERYYQWLDAVSSRPTVKETTPEVSKIIEGYEPYINNTAESQIANAIRKGTALP